MWNSSVNEWKKSPFTHGHIIEYLLWNISYLKYHILAKEDFNYLAPDLDITEEAIIVDGNFMLKLEHILI